MASQKQQEKKKKDRERRVAKEKLAEAARRRAQAASTKEATGTRSRSGKIMSAAVPKAGAAPAGKKANFAHQRKGG